MLKLIVARGHSAPLAVRVLNETKCARFTAREIFVCIVSSLSRRYSETTAYRSIFVITKQRALIRKSRRRGR